MVAVLPQRYYAEKLLEEALANTSGVKVGNEILKKIKHADIQAVLAEWKRDLQIMADNIWEAGIKYGM